MVNALEPSVRFQVQKIIGISNVEGDNMIYQVQWAPSWISALHLVGCENLIKQFKQTDNRPNVKIETVHERDERDERDERVERDEHVERDDEHIEHEIQSSNEVNNKDVNVIQNYIYPDDMVEKKDENEHIKIEIMDEYPTDEVCEADINANDVIQDTNLTDNTIELDEGDEHRPIKIEEEEEEEFDCYPPHRKVLFDAHGGDDGSQDINEAGSTHEQLTDDINIVTVETFMDMEHHTISSSPKKQSYNIDTNTSIISSTSSFQNNIQDDNGEQFLGRNTRNASLQSLYNPATSTSSPMLAFQSDLLVSDSNSYLPASPQVSINITPDAPHTVSFEPINGNPLALMKTFKCSVCIRQFTSLHNLNKHSKVHTTACYGYQCLGCPAKFASRVSLRKHEVKHKEANEKSTNFSCGTCNMNLPDIISYKKHLRKHFANTDTGPVQCLVCAKEFGTTRDLERHRCPLYIKVHNIERPFQCNICQSRFKQQFQVKAHMGKVHALSRKNIQ